MGRLIATSLRVMIFPLGAQRTSRRPRAFGLIAVLASASCGAHPGETGSAASSGASSNTGSSSSSGGGGSGSNSSGSGGSSSSGSGGSSSSGGPTDVCGAASGALAWTATIPATAATLGLVDITTGPTDDVVVADTAGPATFEQHRWSSAGALLSSHQDTTGAFTGPLFTSGLFVDPGNDAFYGMLLTGPQGTKTGVQLTWTQLTPAGTVVFTQTTSGALPTSGGAPSVAFFQVGGDATANLHGAFLMGKPAYVASGVYCYVAGGSNLGASAANVTSTLTPQAFLWPSQDNGLVLFQPVTATTNYGCGSLAVPAAGAVALGKFTGAGSCTWSKLLAIPTAAVKAANFRLGSDGSMLAAVVFTGTINFGGGALQSTGASSLALARFDSAGNLLWAKRFGGAGASFEVGSLGASASGTIILTGGYAGTVDLGGGALDGGHDTFLATFDGAGALKWSKTVTVGAEGSLRAAAGKCGLVLATDSPTVDLGTGPLSTQQGSAPATIGVAALGL
jgi:hypothetical protein